MERTRWNDDLETWCDERYYRKDEVDEMISRLELNSGLVFSVEVDSEIFSVDSGVQEFRANLSWSNGTGVDGKGVLFSLVDGNGNSVDTSLVTTDVDGYAVYEYTPTGKGQVFVTASYGTLLQEIYEVLDCSIYDEGTIASHNDIWGTSSYGTITRQSEYSVASRTQTTDNASFQMNFGDNDTTIIIFDYMKVNGENSDGIVLIRQGSNTNVSTLINNRLGGVIGEWNTVKITIDNNTPRITVDNLTTGHTFTNTMSNTGNRFRWALYGETTEIRFKKFRVYSI